MPLALNAPTARRVTVGRTRRRVAVVLLLSASTAALLSHQRHHGAAPAPAAQRQMMATPVASTAEAAPHIERPVPVPVPAPTGCIALVGDRIAIDIRAMPLGEAARQLAVATRTPLDGIRALRDATGHVTLKWQGANASAAWQQLLAKDVNYLARCVERTCIVSVLGLIAASPVAQSASVAVVAGSRSAWPATTALPSTTAATAVAPSPDPPGLFPSDG